MISSQAWLAFFFGLLSALSLVIGAALGVAWRPPQRIVAAIMAFGAGALLSALAFELVLAAHMRAGFAPVAVGGTIGGVGFIVLNEMLNGSGGFLRKRSTTATFLRARRKEEIAILLEHLSRVPLLRALPPQDIQAIVPHVETVRYTEGERIFSQGDRGDALYLVDKGIVDLYASRGSHEEANTTPAGRIYLAEEPVARLEDGAAFGEMALLTGQGRAATAIAATNVVLLKVPKDDFDELLAVSPGLARSVSELLAQNLEAANAGRASTEDEKARRWQQLALRYVETHTTAPSTSEVRLAAKEHSSSAPMGIFLGLLLDGIPESLVIGMSLIGAHTVSAALIVGLFLSNLPEAMSSAVGMKAQGTGVVRILGMWTFLMLFTGVGALIGNSLFLSAPGTLIAAFEAAAAGAMLTMIAQTALPEAYEGGGWLSGFATLMGFLAAFFVKTLGAV